MKPNILWICADQQRYDMLGCYHNPRVHTTHIDQLAAGGVLFEHAYCQSPICSPSRASFLTGRYPRTTRCRQNGQSIPPDEVLVTRLLADAGYCCGLSGKLHLASCDPQVQPVIEQRINDGYAAFNWSHHPNPDHSANEYIAWLAGRGKKFVRRHFRDNPYVHVGPPAEDHQTTWCAEKAIEFMQSQKPGIPWLFSVNFFDPHHPFDPPQSYLEKYLDRLDDIPLPRYTPGELNHKPPFQQTDHTGAYGGRKALYPYRDMTDEDHRLLRAATWAMCDLIDDQVGRMLDVLNRTGQRENTLVIYMSDHGELLGDHGMYLKGPHFYEQAVHVPLILSMPGVLPQARRSAELVELVDLAPTLLDAVGLERHPGMQGKSLWPGLTERGADLSGHREDVYCEFYNAKKQNPLAQATMVRTATHKLVVQHALNTGELYDLQEDPGEVRNLWDDPAQASVKSDLLLRLTHRMAWTVDPLPPRRGSW